MANATKVGEAHAKAFVQGRWDLEVFARDVLRINLNPAQRRWFSFINPGEDGWQWRMKAVLHVAANQIGKTLGLAIIILWACSYKIGIPIDDGDAWFAAPYQWFHVGPTQNQAYLVINDAMLIVGGSHPAQVGAPLLTSAMVQESKVETYYRGLHFWNGSIAQFRTTEDKARALQGRRAHGISFDECAFEDHLKAVLNETLMMRLVSTGGPIIMVSTPNGINDWFEVVQSVIDAALPREPMQDGDPAVGGSHKVGDLPMMWTTPDHWSLVWSTVEDNIGFGISPDEAARMERDLDPATKEQQLRGAFLEPADAFFVPAAPILEAFRLGLPEDARPEPGHRYVIGWDPSASSDPTVAVVLDATKEPWKGVHFRYFPRPPGEQRLLMEMFALHALYNGAGMELLPHEQPPTAITVYDETSMGGAMLRQSLSGLSPKRGTNLAGSSVKVKLLTNLRAALSTGRLQLPRAWTQMMREVLNYKLPDDKIRQDCVMALTLAADVAARYYSGVATASFRPQGRVFIRKP